MRGVRSVVVLVAIGALGVLLGWAWAQENPQSKPRASPNAAETSQRAGHTISPSELAKVIDTWIARRWQEEHVRPADLSDDAEFLRRVYLDLVGRIPSVAEARAFLEDTSPNKRADLVRRLLHTPAFLNHWSAILAETWLSGSSATFGREALRQNLQEWLREQLRRGSGYDQIVYELLTAYTGAGSVRPNAGAVYSRGSPATFYAAHGYDPRQLAASVSRQFLGIQLDCAECHNHPFAAWKREQFWQLAAFFAGFRQVRAGGQVFYNGQENPQVRSLQIPDTNITVQARFLDGSEPNWESGESTRQVLAKWLTSRDNAYFARAAVNRVWYQLLGYGLTDPPDDMHEGNPPSHPELLEVLGRGFAQSDFDLRFLLEAICLSQAYQLSSRQSDPGQANPRLFARRVVRRLTASQLWDSLVEAAYWNPLAARVDPSFPVSPFGTPTSSLAQQRQAFLEKFRDPASRPVEAETSVLQALALMNGETTARLTQLHSSPMLQIILDYPGWDDARRLETLFLATLTRPPTPHEQTRFLNHVRTSAPRESAWADVFWVLLNSPEFLTNH